MSSERMKFALPCAFRFSASPDFCLAAARLIGKWGTCTNPSRAVFARDRRRLIWKGIEMGLFGPPKYFRERTFTMPCTPREAISVIAGATDLDGGQPFGAVINSYLRAQERGEPVGQAPVAETVYLESLSDEGMVIAAGNRAQTMWRLKLTLSGSNPVNGSFAGLDVKTDRWFKNVWNFNSALGAAVRSVGGKTLKWPSEF